MFVLLSYIISALVVGVLFYLYRKQAKTRNDSVNLFMRDEEKPIKDTTGYIKTICE